MPKRLEHLPRPHGVLDAVAEHVPGAFDGVADGAGQFIDDPLGKLLGFFVGRADADALEVLRERALRLADAHAVVVEDDEQLPLERAGAVEAFEGHAVDDRGIADDRNDVVVALEVLIAAAMPTAVLMAVPAWPTANRS